MPNSHVGLLRMKWPGADIEVRPIMSFLRHVNVRGSMGHAWRRSSVPGRNLLFHAQWRQRLTPQDARSHAGGGASDPPAPKAGRWGGGAPPPASQLRSRGVGVRMSPRGAPPLEAKCARPN